MNVPTFLALLGGFFVYSLQQLVAARRNNATLSARDYFFEHWPETFIATVCGLVFYFGQSDFVAAFPALSDAIGLRAHQTIIFSFAWGLFGQIAADFLGGRIKALSP